ncbi:MAG: hypothetical protein NTV22_12750, partial [bacterium]|nr:hypothetical protein [bacterium]
MKKWMLLITVWSAGALVAAGATTNASAQAAGHYPAVISPAHALMRGGANACTFWMEMPRNLVIENVNHPGLGVGSGLLKGVFYTTSRALLTVGDFMFLGCTGPSAYNPLTFPEYVSASQWDPYTPPTSAQKKVEKAEEKQYEAVDSI